MNITIEADQDTIISLAGGIGALRALVAQQTFAKEDLERIKELFKQIEQEHNKNIENEIEEVNPGEADYALIEKTKGENSTSLNEFMKL